MWLSPQAACEARPERGTFTERPLIGRGGKEKEQEYIGGMRRKPQRKRRKEEKDSAGGSGREDKACVVVARHTDTQLHQMGQS